MSESNELKQIDILLVEDNPGDVNLTRKALDKSLIKNDLFVVEDGLDALRFLRSEGEYSDSPRPDLVLLDLNLPRMNGEEVLEDVKNDPDLRRIPIVVLTSSEAEEDIVKSYNEHANAYLTKPVTFNAFTDLISKLEGFWFSIVQLPPDS